MIFNKKILALTKDVNLIEKQLKGEFVFVNDLDDLMDNISTDEITPARTCYYYDNRLGHYCLTGLRGNIIKEGSLFKNKFSVIVSGYSKGCGSSRETAPYSELFAGAKLIIARSFEKIYRQNCQNIGLHTSTDFNLINRILNGEEISIEDLMEGQDDLAKAIISVGGLLKFSKENMAMNTDNIPVKNDSVNDKPLTLVQKIIMKNLSDKQVPTITSESAVWIKTDLRFSHDYVTAMAKYVFEQTYGGNATVANSDSIICYRDHLLLVKDVLNSDEKSSELIANIDELANKQRAFANKHRIRLHEGESICHLGIVDNYAMPSSVVIGTDSHTCSAGALGCFSFGVGATDMAYAWLHQKVRTVVPETLRVFIKGKVGDYVCAKDIILKLLSMEYFKMGNAIGKVIEFAGPVIRMMEMDERVTLTNMSVELGCLTGIIEPDEILRDFLSIKRGIPKEEIEKYFLCSDVGAEYCNTIEINMTDILPMVASPGDPHNGIPVDSLVSKIYIDIAYGGSCTGGKCADMDMYAQVLKKAKIEGRSVADNVSFFIQFGSNSVKEYAMKKGYIDIFNEFCVTLLEPGCGACINSGPGVSTAENQVTVSSMNRNFKGRSGPGQMYLANPFVVAASALAGFITTPE